MKILITCDPEIPVPPGKYGGVERLVSGLCRQYQLLGHDVYLVANERSTEAVKKFFGWRRSHSRGLKSILSNGLQLREIVKGVKPDVIHSFSRLMYLYPMFLTGTKVHVLQTYGRAISQKSTDLAQKICGRYIHFACCGAHMLNRIDKTGDWHVVYNFTEADYFNVGVAERSYLAFLGRIEDIKGTYEAIQVAKKSGIPLVIAGNVEHGHQEYFDTKVKPYIDGVFIRYIGPVDDKAKQELLERAKAFLMPIKWEEPFGIVMIEAMACGAPVLAFRRGSVPEIVTDETGFISDNVEEMASQCKKLAGFDSKRLHKYVADNFSREKIANDYLELFERFISSK